MRASRGWYYLFWSNFVFYISIRTEVTSNTLESFFPQITELIHGSLITTLYVDVNETFIARALIIFAGF
jgi:hypothetical protein